MLSIDIARRFLKYVELADAQGHHRWLGAYSEKRHHPPRPIFWLTEIRENGKRVGQIIVPAFRIALALYDGIPLGERAHLYACHRQECAQPWCVNPEHGYWGTAEENRWDRYGTGRSPIHWMERMGGGRGA